LPDPESPLEGRRRKKIITDGYNSRGKMSERGREREDIKADYV